MFFARRFLQLPLWAQISALVKKEIGGRQSRRRLKTVRLLRPPNPGGGGGGSPPTEPEGTPPPRTPRPAHPSGLCLLDSTDIERAISQVLETKTRRPLERLNLKKLRTHLQDEVGLTTFVFVMDGKRHRRKRRMLTRHYVERSGWRYIEVCRPRFGFDNADPVADYISWRLDSLAEEWGLRVPAVGLVSHNGAFAAPLARFRDQGGAVAVVGFLEHLHRDLYALTGDQPLSRYAAVRLLDLQLDAHAILLPRRRVAISKRIAAGEFERWS